MLNEKRKNFFVGSFHIETVMHAWVPRSETDPTHSNTFKSILKIKREEPDCEQRVKREKQNKY